MLNATRSLKILMLDCTMSSLNIEISYLDIPWNAFFCKLVLMVPKRAQLHYLGTQTHQKVGITFYLHF